MIHDGKRTNHVDALDPLGYTDEEFYRAKCADLQAEVERLHNIIGDIGKVLRDDSEGKTYVPLDIIRRLTAEAVKRHV